MNIKKSVFILTLCTVSMPDALSSNDQNRYTTKKKRRPIYRTIKNIKKNIMPVARNVLNAIVGTIVSDKGIEVISGTLKDGKIDGKDLLQFGSLLAQNVVKDTMQQPKGDTMPDTLQEQIDKITAQIAWQELMLKEKINNESIIALKAQAEAQIAPLIPNAEDTVTQNTLNPQAQKIAHTITKIMMLDQKASEEMKTIIYNLATSHDVSLDTILSLAAHVSADFAKRSPDNSVLPRQSTTSQNQIESEIKDQLKPQLKSKTLNGSELKGAVQNQVSSPAETDKAKAIDTPRSDQSRPDDEFTTDTSVDKADLYTGPGINETEFRPLAPPSLSDAQLVSASSLN